MAGGEEYRGKKSRKTGSRGREQHVHDIAQNESSHSFESKVDEQTMRTSMIKKIAEEI